MAPQGSENKKRRHRGRRQDWKLGEGEQSQFEEQRWRKPNGKQTYALDPATVLTSSSAAPFKQGRITNPFLHLQAGQRYPVNSVKNSQTHAFPRNQTVQAFNLGRHGTKSQTSNPFLRPQFNQTAISNPFQRSAKPDVASQDAMDFTYSIFPEESASLANPMQGAQLEMTFTALKKHQIENYNRVQASIRDIIVQYCKEEYATLQKSIDNHQAHIQEVEAEWELESIERCFDHSGEWLNLKREDLKTRARLHQREINRYKAKQQNIMMHAIEFGLSRDINMWSPDQLSGRRMRVNMSS